MKNERVERAISALKDGKNSQKNVWETGNIPGL